MAESIFLYIDRTQRLIRVGKCVCFTPVFICLNLNDGMIDKERNMQKKNSKCSFTESLACTVERDRS